MPGGRIHRGWGVLGASLVVELFGLGFGIFAVTTAYPWVIRTFPDWPRTTIFAPTSIIILVAGVMAPITGAVIDRFPIRRVFVAGILVQTAGLLAFGRVTTPGQYLAAAAVIGLGLSGVTILPNQVLVSRWFHARVGLVNGLLLAATALGAAVSPPLVARLIEASDWRTAFTWIAALALGPPLAATLLLVRDRPADLGLLPYGAVSTPEARAATAREGVPLAAAVRTWGFWALAATIVLGGLPCYSLNKHLLVLLTEAGLTPVQAADWKSFYFFVSGCARFSFGWLSDHFDRRRLFLSHLACLAVGYPLVLLIPSHPAVLLPCLVVVGIGYGGLLPAIPILSVHWFGRAHLGSILGVYKIPYDLAAAAAPLLTAYLYDVYGGYAVPERVNAACVWIGLAIALLGLPRRRAASAPDTRAAA